MTEQTATPDRHYWRARALEVLPSATPRQIIRAAHLLREQYDGPTVRYDCIGSTLPSYVTGKLDPRAFDGVTGGGVPDMGAAPTAWQATRHEQTPDGEVRRFGMARVQGSGAVTIAGDLPNGSTPTLLWQMCDDLPRNSVGAASIDILKLTHLFYGPDAELPDLIGTDVAAWRQVVHAAPETDPYTARGVVGRESAVCTLQTWPTRVRLPRVQARKSERVGAPAHALPAPAADPQHIWMGHRLIPRGKTAPRKPRTIRAERTIGTVSVESPLALAEIADNLNRGERVVIRYNGATLTLTRGKAASGTYSLTAPTGKAAGLRTAANVAKRASELVA